MPLGKTHRRIDLFLLVFILGSGAYFWEVLTQVFGRDALVEYGVVFVAGYLFGTFLLSPDMDLYTSDPMKNWGVLRFLWRPYANAFRHRGLSHLPIIGTLTRLVYIAALAYVLLALANAFFDMGWHWRDLQRVDRKSVICGLFGLCLPDLFHIFADRMFQKRR